MVLIFGDNLDGQKSCTSYVKLYFLTFYYYWKTNEIGAFLVRFDAQFYLFCQKTLVINK